MIILQITWQFSEVEVGGGEVDEAGDKDGMGEEVEGMFSIFEEDRGENIESGKSAATLGKTKKSANLGRSKEVEKGNIFSTSLDINIVWVSKSYNL